MNPEKTPSTPQYSIGVVKEKTSLTGRQIRYYEEEGLISPARSTGNHRIYSQNDILKLEQIKELMEQGLSLQGIKKVI